MVSGATCSVPSLLRVKRRAVAVVFEIIWLPTITTYYYYYYYNRLQAFTRGDMVSGATCSVP